MLTLESHSVYKIPLTAPPEATLLFNPTSAPSLTGMRQVICTKHIIEGTQYHFVSQHRFGSDSHVDMTLIMRDPEDDGSFVTPVGYTTAQMDANGYDRYSVYVPLCGRWH